MSALGLGGYGSSDEDDLEDRPTEQPIVEAQTPQNTSAPPAQDVGNLELDSKDRPKSSAPEAILDNAQIGPILQEQPQTPAAEEEGNDDATDSSLSPYSQERQQLRQLTMPPIPNFDIPPSPPPLDDIELAVQSKKIAQFAELKHQGVHYNEKLLSSTAFNNPAMTDKLLAFAGIEGVEQYRSSLPEGHGVNVDYWASLRVEDVVSRIEARRKADAVKPKGSKREFVSGGSLGR